MLYKKIIFYHRHSLSWMKDVIKYIWIFLESCNSQNNLKVLIVKNKYICSFRLNNFVQFHIRNRLTLGLTIFWKLSKTKGYSHGKKSIIHIQFSKNVALTIEKLYSHQVPTSKALLIYFDNTPIWNQNAKYFRYYSVVFLYNEITISPTTVNNDKAN